MTPIDNRKQFDSKLLKQWNRVLKYAENKFIPDDYTVTKFNRWVNNNFEYQAEQEDAWLTPEEFIFGGGGDCEDFAIYKYYGLPYPKYLAIGYVKDVGAHCVLVVYAQEFGDWVVLDNRTNDIYKWTDYLQTFNPIYFCDDKGWYV